MISDYQAIQTQFSLSEVTQKIIDLLSKKFPTTVNTSAPFSNNSENKQKYNKHTRNKPSDDGWQTVREFKTTTIIEKTNKTNDIRVSLNKLSVKHYDTTSDFIITKLKEMKEEMDVEITNTIQIIIDIISTNKVFSSIYAKFYKKLLEELPDLFLPTLECLNSNYIESFNQLKYADSNTQYDDFCKANKQNDRRKAIALFLTNLTIIGLMPIDQIFFMTNNLMDLVQKYISEPDKIYEVEEITENIYILLTTQTSILSKISLDIKHKMSELSKMKNKEQPSLTSRTIFKYVDICEKM